jgi:leucyl aminopeptidase
MLRSALTKLLLLSSTSQLGLSSASSDAQVVFAPSQKTSTAHGVHAVDDAILAALDAHRDPVAALVSLQPEAEAALAEPRLLHVSGEKEPQWMTEGDKLRLRRAGKKFMDITDHHEYYSQQIEASYAGKACEFILVRH